MTQSNFHFQKGLCISAIYPAAVTNAVVLKTALCKMAESGFYTAAEFYHEGPDAQLEDIARHCKSLNLAVVYLAGYDLKRKKLDIASADEAARKQAVAACVSMLKRAQRLGAEKMLILSGENDPARDRTSVISSTVKSVQELITEGEQRFGSQFPQITLEFFNPSGEPYLSVGTPEVSLAIASQVNSEHFGITFDTSHVAQMGFPVAQTMDMLHPWVTHLHLANSVSRHEAHPLYGDKHPLFDIPQGDFTAGDITAFLRYCQEKQLLNRVDICSAEVICREAGEEDACYSKLLKQLHTIFSSTK